ncbi:MAG: hypothetical protein AB7P76_08640 [Candidatus Melainabacteria bacterium]
MITFNTTTPPTTFGIGRGPKAKRLKGAPTNALDAGAWLTSLEVEAAKNPDSKIAQTALKRGQQHALWVAKELEK